MDGESGRDRDALIAYHHEVANEAGYTQLARKALKIFGVLGGAATGSVAGMAVAGPVGAPLGAVVGSGVSYLLDLAAKREAGWKPVVFGNWYKARIHRVLDRSA